MNYITSEEKQEKQMQEKQEKQMQEKQQKQEQDNNSKKRKAIELDSDSDSDSGSDSEQLQDETPIDKDDLKKTLQEIEKAIKLDTMLPESQKSQNSHLKSIEKEYSTFFDEESGNDTKEGLRQVKDYIKEEIISLENKSLELSQKTQTPGDFVDEQKSLEMPSIFDDTE